MGYGGLQDALEARVDGVPRARNMRLMSDLIADFDGSEKSLSQNL